MNEKLSLKRDGKLKKKKKWKTVKNENYKNKELAISQKQVLRKVVLSNSVGPHR